ncbi:MAG: ASCH domain-containing protein [Nanoarchaeota archaeon]
MNYDFLHHKDKEAFNNIKNKEKVIEIRLFDEKRRKIKQGHIIKVVSQENNKDYLFIKVIKLSKFNSFNELYDSFKDQIKDYEKDILSRVYSKEKEEKYGVLVIHFNLLD